MNSVTVFVIQSALIALILNKSCGNSQMLQCDTKTGFLSQKLWTGLENITTPQNIQYKFYPLSLVSTPYEGCVTFKVLTKSDAHIILSHAAQQLQPTLEVVLGGWSNSRSVIRSQYYTANSIEHSIYEANDTVSGTEFKEFSIHWQAGQINVYAANEQEPFLTHNNPDLFPINFLGIFTCCGSVGTWNFQEPKCPQTKSTRRIRCSKPSRTDIESASIADYIRHQSNLLQNMRNDWLIYNNSEITSELVVLEFIEDVTESITDAEIYHQQIIGSVKEGDQEEIEIYLESSLFQELKETYYHMIITFITDQIRLTKTADALTKTEYKFMPLPKNSTSYLFKVISASEDILIALTQTQQLQKPIFELRLSSTQLPTLFKNFNQNVAVGSPIILNEDHDYLLTWANGVIHLRDLKNDETILKYTEPNMFKVNYIGVNPKDTKEDHDKDIENEVELLNYISQ